MAVKDERDFYTAPEAIALLRSVGLSESTFYRWVREGIISKQLPPGRQRGARYPKKEVEDLIEREGTDHPTEESEGEEVEPIGVTDWIRASDLPYVLALDYELYGPANYVDMSITRTWWEKNPRMCRILYDGEDRRYIWGALTIMPLAEETIFKLLRGEMEEREITADDIQTYEPGGRYYGYVASAAIRPEHHHRLRMLIHSMLDFWCEQYPDVRLEKLYAYAASDEGLGMMKHLFFSPRYDLGENAFELNPYRYNPSPIIQSFQECIKERAEAANQQGKRPKLVFRLATRDDQEEEYELAQRIFGPATHDLETRLRWYDKNPEMDYVVTEDEEIVAYLNLMPVKHETIMAFMNGDIRGWQISTDDIEPFAPGRPLECIAMAMATTPDAPEPERKAYSATLLHGMANVLTSFGERGVEITRIYATSATPSGISLLLHAGFLETGTRLGKRIAFLLDVQASDLPLLRGYKAALSRFQNRTAVAGSNHQ